jgi:putative flippase GtrA
MRVFVRYFTSGFIATISHFAVLVLLIEYLFTNPMVASVVGFIVAIFVNYHFQYHWTFGCSAPFTHTFVRYLMVTLFMLFLNAGLFSILYYSYTIHYIIAQALVTSVVFLCNYLINKHYTFACTSTK